MAIVKCYIDRHGFRRAEVSSPYEMVGWFFESDVQGSIYTCKLLFSEIENGYIIGPFHEQIEKNNNLSCILAQTIKGKGSSIMENQKNWHYWNPMTDEQIKKEKRCGLKR